VVGWLITTLREVFLLNLPVNFFTAVNIWQSCKQEGGCPMHFMCLATTPLNDEEFTRHLEYGDSQLLLTVGTPLLTLPG